MLSSAWLRVPGLVTGETAPVTGTHLGPCGRWWCTGRLGLLGLPVCLGQSKAPEEADMWEHLRMDGGTTGTFLTEYKTGHSTLSLTLL